MGFHEIKWQGVEWIDLDKNKEKWWAVVIVEMKLRVAQNAGHFLAS
jgi:hypothetical protein